MPRALISVSDKTGLVAFARGLAARGFELVSTGGTAKTLQDNGLPVVSVSEVTGFPEMMDGRVKTLHPRIHGGILARRASEAHLAAARDHGIGLIDVVAVNLYPFAAAAANPATPFDGLVEEIDIGGPSLVRGRRRTLPTCWWWCRPRTIRRCSRSSTARAVRARRSGSTWRGRRLPTPGPTTPRLPRPSPT